MRFILYTHTYQFLVSRYVDPRTRRDRTDLQTNHWDMQMNELVHAYLEYRSRDSGDGLPTVLNENDSPSLNTAPALSNIELVDTFCRS